ncbi:unnamed protein product [Meloidogyne enterolobii]|uniref:Uncharacterized protein n=1 Tax=Meloidogyne enterolobii TaxID=390850 RepID=A0ACB1AKA5_MELEN
MKPPPSHKVTFTHFSGNLPLNFSFLSGRAPRCCIFPCFLLSLAPCFLLILLRLTRSESRD